MLYCIVACVMSERRGKDADMKLKAEGAALDPSWYLAVSRAETWLGKK